MAANVVGRIVAENDKRRLDDQREVAAGNPPLQPQDMLGEIGGRKRPPGGGSGANLSASSRKRISVPLPPPTSGQSGEEFRPRQLPIGPVGDGGIVEDDRSAVAS